MAENSWLLEYYFINEQGVAEQKREYPEKLYEKTPGYDWIHLDAASNNSRAWLSRNLEVDNTWVDVLLAKEIRPRFIKIDDNTFFINVCGINFFNKDEPEDMISIRVFVTKNQIISATMRDLKAVEKVKKDLETKYSPKSTAEFLLKLLEHINEEIENMVIKINNEIDDLEENVLIEHDKDYRQNVIGIRRQMIIFKRHLFPNLDAIRQLVVMNNFFKKHSKGKNKLMEISHKMTRFTEEIMSIKERAQVIHEELNNNLTEKLSSSTNKLSAVATTFLPMGFITGLFGVNVGGMPGAENSNAFAIFSIVTIIILLIQIIIFRWLKWF